MKNKIVGAEQTEYPLGKPETFDVDTVRAQLSHVQGKILTIVEAVIEDERQLKATKDLINNAFSNQLSYVWQMAWPDTRMLTRDEAESTIDNLEEVEKGAEAVE